MVVESKATLSWILEMPKFSLKELIANIFDPGVLSKSELERNRVFETINPADVTFTLTVFCDVVVSNTWPVATAALTPSLRESVAPLV